MSGDRGQQSARPRELWIAALISLLFSLPFLGKAVQQDDWAYLAIAPAYVDAGDDWKGEVTYYQGEAIPASEGILHGPVWLTILAWCLALGDGGMLLPHLAMALFGVLLTVSCTSLAGKLGARPLWAGLMVGLSPPFLVMTGSVMTDLPMVALFTASMALAVAGLERNSRTALIGAGILGAGAALTRYHGLAVVPMLAVAPLLWPTAKRLGLRAYLPAMIAALLSVGYLIWTYMSLGAADIERAQSMFAAAEIDTVQCGLALVAALGFCALPMLVGATLSPQAFGRAVTVEALLWSAGGLACGWWLYRVSSAAMIQPTGINLILTVASFGLGGVVLACALRPLVGMIGRGSLDKGRQRWGREAWLGLWTLGFAFAAWRTVPFGATRYALPALVPALLLGSAALGRKLSKRSSVCAAVLTLLLALGAAEADRRAGEGYRQWGMEVAQRMESDPAWSRGKSWVWGELGFRYYLEREAGCSILPSDYNSEVHSGDRIFKSSLCTATPDDGLTGLYALDRGLVERMESAEIRVLQDSWPVRIHNAEAAAGFFHGAAGFLPMAFSTAPHDRLQVWDVTDPNPFFTRFDGAHVEPLVEARPLGGNARVGRLSVNPEFAMRMCLALIYPARVRFDAVPVPPESRLLLELGENRRLWSGTGSEGYGARLRVLVNGEVVIDQALDARHNEQHRRWIPVEADLSKWGGEAAEFVFESTPLPAPEGKRWPEPEMTFSLFANPRFASRID